MSSIQPSAASRAVPAGTAARRARVAPIIERQRAQWQALPAEQRTPDLRCQVAARLHNGGKGLRPVEMAEVFGCSPELARQALRGWLPVTERERDLLAFIRQADKGAREGPHFQRILVQARAAADFSSPLIGTEEGSSSNA